MKSDEAKRIAWAAVTGFPRRAEDVVLQLMDCHDGKKDLCALISDMIVAQVHDEEQRKKALAHLRLGRDAIRDHPRAAALIACGIRWGASHLHRMDIEEFIRAGIDSVGPGRRAGEEITRERLKRFTKYRREYDAHCANGASDRDARDQVIKENFPISERTLNRALSDEFREELLEAGKRERKIQAMDKQIEKFTAGLRHFRSVRRHRGDP